MRIVLYSFVAVVGLVSGVVACGDDGDGGGGAANNEAACQSLEDTLAACDAIYAGILASTLAV